MKIRICQICGRESKIAVGIVSHGDKERSESGIFCRECWNKYYRPAMVVVTELLDEIKRGKK